MNSRPSIELLRSLVMPRFALTVLVLSSVLVLQASAQNSASPVKEEESFSHFLTARVKAKSLPANERMKQYVADGRLRLSLQEAVLLTLENNSDIQIQEMAIETQKFSLLSAHQIFDPLVTSSLNITRYSSPTYTQLQGVGGTTVANALTQTGEVGIQQFLATGTTLSASLSSTKSSTNSSYYLFNPYYSSTLSLNVTQPLLRKAGIFANTASLVIARRSLQQSRATFEAEVNDAILQVVQQYWTAVEARSSLDVQTKSLELAEVSYQRDKHALELGALPPLDIYRSESEVATRKLQVIEARHTLEKAEEALRFTLGANQAPVFSKIEINLTETPKPSGELVNVDPEQALTDALVRRPELDAARAALANDETSVRLARSLAKPDLSFTGFYQTSGIGANPSAFGASMSQAFGFGAPGYGGQLSLSLPVRNRAALARIGTAMVTQTQDRYTDRKLHETITREVKNALHQLDIAKLELSAGAASVDLAQKTLAADQRKFELGAETNYFVLDAQSRLAQAELSLLDAQINYQIARASVEHATGNLLASYRVQIRENQ